MINLFEYLINKNTKETNKYNKGLVIDIYEHEGDKLCSCIVVTIKEKNDKEIIVEFPNSYWLGVNKQDYTMKFEAKNYIWASHDQYYKNTIGKSSFCTGNNEWHDYILFDYEGSEKLLFDNLNHIRRRNFWLDYELNKNARWTKRERINQWINDLRK